MCYLVFIQRIDLSVYPVRAAMSSMSLFLPKILIRKGLMKNCSMINGLFRPGLPLLTYPLKATHSLVPTKFTSQKPHGSPRWCALRCLRPPAIVRHGRLTSLFTKNIGSDFGTRYTLGCPPSQDASHHQDYYIFSRDPYKPSFATVTGRGDNPR